MFDSPIQNRADLVGRYTVAYFIWGYPVTYAVTLFIYYLLRRCGVWRVLSCLAWAFPVAAWFILSAYLVRQGEPSNAGRVQLLYRTDYAALLAACRDVMVNRHTFRNWDDRGWEDIDPKDPKVPAAITALQPRSIGVSDNTVVLGLHGGFDRYDVIAVSESTLASSTNGMSDDLQLIPGLWLNDEQLLYHGTDRTAYLNKLRALKPTDAPPPKW